MNRTGRKWWWLGGAVVLLVGGGLALRSAVFNYLQSTELRERVGVSMGKAVKGRGEVGVLRFEGSALSAENVRIAGSTESPFASLELERPRVLFDFSGLWRGVWVLEKISMERAVLDLQGPRFPWTKATKPQPPPTAPSTSGGSWLPRKAEVNAAEIRQATITWKGGAAGGMRLTAQRQDREWVFQGEGGTLGLAGYPEAQIGHLSVRRREDAIFINEVQLTQGTTGRLTVDGEIRPQESLDISARLTQLPVQPLLTPDWRQRLSGNLHGEVKIRGSLPMHGAPEVSGKVRFTEGRLEALPILNELALVTLSPRFRTLTFSKAEADFRRTEERLEITRLTAESAGLLRVEGALTVAGGQMVGDFQIGVTPSTLQWLPGIRERLFSPVRDGYCWTPMHLEGPVDSPREDLSARLAQAAVETGVQTLRDASGQAKEAVRQLQEVAPLPDAAKKVLDIFLK